MATSNQNASQDLFSTSPRSKTSTDSDTETKDQSHAVSSDALQSELHQTQFDSHQDNTRDAGL